MNNIMYDIPESVSHLFEIGEKEYRIIDYSAGSMDNNQSMSYFIQLVKLDNYIHENNGTQVTVYHPDYDYMITIDAGGLGDFYSHSFSAKIHQR